MTHSLGVIPFGKWRPDAADLLSGFSTIAKNVYPGPTSFRPFPALGTTTRMSALTGRPQGAAAFKSPLNQLTYLVVGDNTKLYQRTAATAISVGGATYSCPPDEWWEFATAGGYFIAANIDDPIQGALMNTQPLAFANLVDSSLQPQARHIAVVGKQLMIANTLESGTYYPNRVRWCAVTAAGAVDPTDFDESQTTLADHQDIEGLGSVKRVVGGKKSALILCDEGTTRFDFVGTPDIYVQNPLENGVGCIQSRSVAQQGSLAYYLSRHGFVVCDGVGTQGIGDEKVDQWFFDNWSESLSHRMSTAVDGERHLIIWAFTSSAEVNGANPDTLLFYHTPSGEWAYANVDTKYIFTAKTAGVTLEDLDTHELGGTNIDAMETSLDSAVWDGGADVLAGFDNDNEMVYFDGANLAATIETGDFEHFKGHRTIIDKVSPKADGGTLSVSLAVRDRLNDTVTFGSAVTQNSDGVCPFESGNSGRYVRYRFQIASGGSWSHAEGFDPIASDGGAY